MKYIRVALCLVLSIMMAQPLLADNQRKIDDTIAAGVVFKISYIAGSQGPWHDPNNDAEDFVKGMATVESDLRLFSDTEHGRKLKVEGRKLINFFVDCVTFSADPDSVEYTQFLKQLGYESRKPTVEEFAKLLMGRLEAYAKLSRTPRRGYHPNKTEGGDSEAGKKHTAEMMLYLEELSDYVSSLEGVESDEFAMLSRRFAYKSFSYYYLLRNGRDQTGADKFWWYAFRVMNGKSGLFGSEGLWSSCLDDPCNIKRLISKRDEFTPEQLDGMDSHLPVRHWLFHVEEYDECVKGYRKWIRGGVSEGGS